MSDYQRAAVSNFADAMEDKLRMKDAEYGKEGWLEPQCTAQFLLDRLMTKVIDLAGGFQDCDQDTIQQKAVDAANFAMMLYDRIESRW